MFEKSDRRYLALFVLAGLSTLPLSVLKTPTESYVDLKKDMAAQTVSDLRVSGYRVIVHHKNGDKRRVILPVGSTLPDEAINQGIPTTIKDDALLMGLGLTFLSQILVGFMACLIVFWSRSMRKPPAPKPPSSEEP